MIEIVFIQNLTNSLNLTWRFFFFLFNSAFNLQPRNNAGDCVDYVAIYRLLLNKDTEAVLEGKFCGNSIPSPISIGKSSLTVQFISDSGPDSLSYTGFSLNYKAYFEDSK